VQSNVPIWRRGDSTWRTVARTTTTSLSESAPQTLTHSAESIHIAATREASPIGGETALNPQPPMIAYDEGAEGTVVFQVFIDERGVPTKCVITKSSNYTVLDATVCKAAMEARYTPKTVGGRAVPGTYQDAFTFRSSQDNQRNNEGIPKTIP
jgi:protein TonB